MYKLVIVEDERDVRQRIIGMIEKADSAFQLVGEYENGIDAYDGIQSDSPDLIITDIKIPYINGIELAERVRQILPLVKIIVITGYNEFDYAKQAANLGVLGFVSKPVTLKDIQMQLYKAQEALDNEYLTSASLNQLEAFYEQSLPIVRENDLYRLSTLADVGEAFEKKLKYNDIDLAYRYFAMCMLDFDQSTDSDPEHYELAFASVRGIVEESFRGFCELEQFRRFERLCLILKSGRPMEVADIEQRLERVLTRVGRYSGMPMSASLSRVYDNSRNFAAMRKEATRALEHRRAMGGGKVFYYGNMLPTPGAMLMIDDGEIKELGYLLRFKSAGDWTQALRRIRQKLEPADSHNSYYYVLTAILNTLLKACDDLDGLFRQYAGQDGVYQRLFEIKTADEAFAYFERLAGSIRRLNDSIIVDNVERNLQKVLDYVQAHYCDPGINFETVAANVNFSVSYISALFKKNLNSSFVKYLTALRMERAQELLQKPDLKIVDIAEQLGYSDPYYFSHCFKKHTGVSPKEFRNHE